MNEVVIEYLRFSRKKERVRYGPETTKISLSGMAIQEIDFVEVAPLERLRILDLGDNNLETIDLGFLRENSELQEIDVHRNEILSIDTEPLKDLEKLRELRLSENLMKGLDLSGLSHCQGLETLNLSNNHIHRINLEPLCFCLHLNELNLQGNQLNSIDLSPLNTATELQYLDISHNWIRNIDLSPLSGNHALRVLDMSENPISEINLLPLQECSSLESLILNWTQIEEIDLSPLSSCSSLKRLGIAHNKVREIDFLPITKCSDLRSIDISGIMTLDFNIWPLFSLSYLEELRISAKPKPQMLSPPHSVDWPSGLEQYRKTIRGQSIEEIISTIGFREFNSKLHEISDTLGPLGKFFVRIAVLETFDLIQFKGYDSDILNVMVEIPNSHSYEDVRTSLRNILAERLIDQVHSGGSTHLIDIALSQKIPELAVITPSILKIRKEELERVILVQSNETVNLMPLWFTSYGYDILSALRMGLSTNLSGIERIRGELANAGIELNIQNEERFQPANQHLSEELQAYIIMHAIQNSSTA